MRQLNEWRTEIRRKTSHMGLDKRYECREKTKRRGNPESVPLPDEPDGKKSMSVRNVAPPLGDRNSEERGPDNSFRGGGGVKGQMSYDLLRRDLAPRPSR